MPAAVHTFDRGGDEFDGPVSFKRPSASLRKNITHTPSSASLKPNSSAQRCQRSKLKRLRAEEDDLMSDDSDDEKPIALRMKICERKSKIINAGGAKADGDRDQDSDDEKPMAARLAINSAAPKTGGDVSDDDSEDDKPLTARFSRVTGGASRNSVKRTGGRSDQTVSALNKAKPSDASDSSSVENEPKDELQNDGRKKWSTLEHNGVVFPPPYKPHGVKMLYNGQPVGLSPEQEEVATMFAVMKDTEYASKETFINNFFTDWRKILAKTHVITKFELCDFTPIYEWHLREKEKKNQMTSEEKKALREEKSKQDEKFMWASVDGVKEKVGNFRVEPPGLFRGRGEHPKMGRLKRRIRPSDITINIGEEAPVPVCPIPKESWKEVKHDNTVTWLACWNDPINKKDIKYVFLAASSSLKGQSDQEKYEKARKLKDYIGSIRANYTKDFRSKDQRKKQTAVATYLIDKLALRAGNEKDEADTVGCCTLKVENVTCLPPNKLQFDFLGKYSIRYYNTVEVELAVYQAIKELCAGKNKGGHVFDKLDTTKLNAHLKDLMPGLTAKVFRTYNASITLDTILSKETKDGTVGEKVKVYQRANKQVAIICNHQRAVPKSHDSQMNKLNEKIDELTAQRDQLNAELEKAKKLSSKKANKRKCVDADGDGKRRRKLTPEMLEKKLSQIETMLVETDNHKNTKEDLKTVALGTSKINYLDPRITVAWCKTHEVPIDRDKIFTKTILEKFAWAMDVDPEFRF